MNLVALAIVIVSFVLIAAIWIGFVLYVKLSPKVRTELAMQARNDAVAREFEIEDIVKLKGGVENLDPKQRRRWDDHQTYLMAVERTKQERRRAAGPADPLGADAWRYQGE